jgi:hypothetical protein
MPAFNTMREAMDKAKRDELREKAILIANALSASSYLTTVEQCALMVIPLLDALDAADAAAAPVNEATWWWWSVCSEHQTSEPGKCRRCRVGRWICKAHSKGNCEQCDAIRARGDK